MRDSISLHPWLAPFAFLYGLGVCFRNWLFDAGLLRSERFPLPVICIGNIAVGGTGKTPHTEYLIRLLKERYRIAVLSRGYKRTTSGFRLATGQSRCEEIGDEPYQMKRKFPDIQVAVDADRRRGIRQLLALPPDERPEVILLDDAFQHRYVCPSLRILLTDNHRLYTHDQLLPMGRLRESAQGARRADIIVVTKCDPKINPMEVQLLKRELTLSPWQALFVSTIAYGDVEPLFPDEAPTLTWDAIASEKAVLLVSGIASPASFEQAVRTYTDRLITLAFPDHHAFTPADIQKIQRRFDQLDASSRIMITTEKDAARLRELTFLPWAWRNRLYVLPIRVEFPLDGEERFRSLIWKHIDTCITDYSKDKC